MREGMQAEDYFSKDDGYSTQIRTYDFFNSAVERCEMEKEHYRNEKSIMVIPKTDFMTNQKYFALIKTYKMQTVDIPTVFAMEEKN